MSIIDPLRRLTGFVALPAATLALIACTPADIEPQGPTRADFDAAAWPHEVSDLPADPSVAYGVLDNGMRYAILQNDTPSGVAAIRLVLNVGSLAESDAQRGLAHFIEHMAFNGTTNVPEGEMVPLLERYGLAFGPDTNAFTGREVVGYQLDLPSVEDEVVDVGLFLIREAASEMVMSTEAIDRERGIILGEERFRNTPIRRFFNAYYDFLYPDTIITERDAIGTVEVIENAPREEFLAYYRDYYVPERAILVVVGDIDPAEIESKIRDGYAIDIEGVDLDQVEGFSTWVQPEEAGADPVVGTVSDVEAERFGLFHDPEVFTLINVDVVTPGEEAVDTVETRTEGLLRGLGNGIVQRRLQTLINSGASPLVQANMSYTNDFDLANRAGMFGVSSPERWREAVGVMEQELRRALEHGFTQAELDEQLANVRTSLGNGADQAGTRRSDRLSDEIWQTWLGGDVFIHPSYALEWFESKEAEFTVEAVETAFNEVWSAAPAQVYVALNEDLADGAAQVEAAWRASQSEPVEAPEIVETAEFAYTEFGSAGEIVSRTSVDDLGFEQIVFDNGVRLNVKTTDFEDSRIRVQASFGAGDLTPQPTPAAGSILGAAFGGGGLEAHDRDELQRIFAGRSVGYGIGVGDDSFFFSNTTTPDDFELQLQVWAAFMIAPGWREDGLNQYRAIAEEIRRGQNAQAVQVAVNRVGRMLRSGDARWGFPTSEEIAAFTMDHARAMLADSLASAPLEVTIVGDVTADRAIEVVASTLAALPDRASEWPAYEENASVSFPAPNEVPEIVRFNGQPYQGMANIYWPTDDAMDIRKARALNLMTAVYDLKATDRFREQDGATYSAIVSNSESNVFEDFGFVWVGLDVAAAEVERMYAIADELAEAMRSGDVTEDELLRARQPILESIEESRESNGYWIGALSRSQAQPERLARIRSQVADYESFVVADIVALAEEYLQPDRAYRVSIFAEGVDPANPPANAQD
ncbi:MAG: insulinase family protein [Pseudomonadota bacterium]